jgi:hypothetical protein
MKGVVFLRPRYSINPVPRIAPDEVSNEEAGVHRAFVLGLIGSVLGLARPEGQWLCRRGDLGSQRGEEPNTH